MSVVVVEVVQVALLVAVSMAVFGWRPDAGVSVGLTVAGLVTGTLAFAGLGLVLAGALRPEATLAIANGLFLLFLLLGGIVLPLDHLPPSLEGVARLLPASALSDLVRIGLGAATGDAVRPAIILVAWAVGAVALAARTFRWE